MKYHDGDACETPAHADAIQRMIAATPRYRPDATSSELVADFAIGECRMPAFLTLYTRGDDALPAIRDGLEHADSNVRRWCALFADNFADAQTLHALLPLLEDPSSEVRLWAVHSISCETCKDGPNPVDAVPLLLERIETDASIRVRRQAVAMLAHHLPPDTRALSTLRRILATETDQKLRLHARAGVRRYSGAGLHEA